MPGGSRIYTTGFLGERGAEKGAPAVDPPERRDAAVLR